MEIAAFLDRVTAWAESRDDVHALVLLGSQARTDTPADRWSDIDLLLVTDEPEAFLRDAEWLVPLGRPLLTFLEPTAVGGSTERRVLFETGEEVDFAVFSVEAVERAIGAPRVLRRGFRVLVDRIGIAASLEELASTPPEPEARDLAQLSNDFWYHALWAAKKLRRGETWIAWRSCNGYLQSLLVTLLRWRAEARGIDAWHDGRFLERWADTETLLRLREAGGMNDPVDVARALRAVASLFADVECDYAEAARVPVPVDQTEIRRRLDDVLTS
jgi:aminoglycoside 6-adenylyltransferase